MPPDDPAAAVRALFDALARGDAAAAAARCTVETRDRALTILDAPAALGAAPRPDTASSTAVLGSVAEDARRAHVVYRGAPPWWLAAGDDARDLAVGHEPAVALRVATCRLAPDGAWRVVADAEFWHGGARDGPARTRHDATVRRACEAAAALDEAGAEEDVLAAEVFYALRGGRGPRVSAPARDRHLARHRVYARYASAVFARYLEAWDDGVRAVRDEALKRLAFLSWRAATAPSADTGISEDLPFADVARVWHAVAGWADAASPDAPDDAELVAMLGWYYRVAPAFFAWRSAAGVPDAPALERRLAEREGAPDLGRVRLADRGAMGRYFAALRADDGA